MANRVMGVLNLTPDSFSGGDSLSESDDVTTARQAATLFAGEKYTRRT